ncbi:hypothetical protein [Xanthomonas rydalmerensis]|uniref:Secreted protein n=1 Tax=Xanthomonas rydalmerensis TaxID=3046274 RepID=A0ABZ0JSH8_9XANT|nr:hypothetical protein [Xanthomonas sp. DM-2023]WOS42788.1 hypothetical protein QN243_10305 [Xanthomonas sp. DM-2023]WOS46974.1 hypothetical protein QN242_10305 [Xanthomonas sp. DM-2023]WOS51153.1 hypothetical protein QN240_10305 [Xanthomonas sp. DM-2023]WOS55334.1 hypothetical protein QN244_10305 [Xanthomonas sp. DM-2023]WOS59516.1 hypothetical protein QN245_10305 [Xanthomonas sp. DM-2023]
MLLAIAITACAVVVAGGVLFALRSHGHGVPTPRAAATTEAHPPTVPAFHVAPLSEDAADKRITTLLQSDAAFARDATFLIVASIRERCAPAHAGELAKMANRARLPVLAATSEVTAREPDLDHPIYQAIQRIAAAAPCGRTLDLMATGIPLQLDPERYAAAFPDSYYQPTLDTVPHEYAGQPLGDRAAQECQSIAYAVLPLGRDGWQCRALWSGMRPRIVKACEQARSEAGQGAGDAIPPEVANRLTPVVAGLLEKLPESCR